MRLQARAEGLYVEEKLDLLVNYLVVYPIVLLFGKFLKKVSGDSRWELRITGRLRRRMHDALMSHGGQVGVPEVMTRVEGEELEEGVVTTGGTEEELHHRNANVRAPLLAGSCSCLWLLTCRQPRRCAPTMEGEGLSGAHAGGVPLQPGAAAAQRQGGSVPLPEEHGADGAAVQARGGCNATV